MEGYCYCQNACNCMAEDASLTTITRDSAVDALPGPCNGGSGGGGRKLKSRKAHK